MCEGVLHPLRLQNLVREWLLEDTSSFDFGGGVVGDRRCEFTIYMKSSGVLAGIPFVNALFRELNLQVTWLQKEGDRLNPITEIAKVYGPAKSLLLSERLVLNILSRASGVATAAARLGDIVRQAHWHGTVSGSRKTTPGFRMVEKYALIVGGVDTHRYDLSSMVMLKDNHISLSGSIEEAVQSARRLCGFALKIEVECRSLPEALEACRANCDVVMLDNFEPECSHDRSTARNGDKMVVHKIISEDLGMRKICAKLVPKVLTDVQKQDREAVSKDLLERIEKNPLFFDNVITGDESWFFQFDPETKCQSNRRHTPQSPRQKKARMSESRMKPMLIVFFDKNGVVHSKFVPEGQTVNGTFYEEVLKRLERRVNRVRPEISAYWKLHHDNAPSHTCIVVTEHLTKNDIVTIPQPQQTFSSSPK
ncbi:nicotinate-nucleotide pyrophosphorylase [Trichonephila clavipes]|uniref:Nicotinate-nucleotide pyrophosphorylase [carboxylating] n=1 Tax=Trichonephila clavipes TaxID=2585209 RepID=A0A8X6S2G5_TRICX|nr:nicotinate-nucleotide pyrophosphorylase [Trichonephila clavipes]